VLVPAKTVACAASLLAVALFASTARADDPQPPGSDPPSVTLPAEPDPNPDPAPPVSKPAPATPTHTVPSKPAARVTPAAAQLPSRTQVKTVSTRPPLPVRPSRSSRRHKAAVKRVHALRQSREQTPAPLTVERPLQGRFAVVPFRRLARSAPSSGGGSNVALLVTAAVSLTAALTLFALPGVLPRFAAGTQLPVRRLRFPKWPGAAWHHPAQSIKRVLPPTRVPLNVAATCEVRVFRGYVKSHFYAEVLPSPGQRPAAVAQSPWFRCRGTDPAAAEPEVVAAHDHLLRVLAANDWVRLGRGSQWYSDRLVRRANG
jgi:hypothetical protein